MKKLLLFFLFSSLSLSAQMAITPARNSSASASSVGLPLQWLMHEGSGQTLHDSTPNNDTLNCTNLTWGTGTFNPSPTFNGTNASCEAVQTSITNFDGTQPFSVSVWSNPSQVSTETAFVSTLNPSGNFQGWEFGANLNNGLPVFFLVNVYPTTTLNVAGLGASVVAGTTYNYIVTYSAATKTTSDVTLYLDGAVVSPNPVTNTLSGSTASGLPLYVGARSDGTIPYAGSMSNVQIFSGVLTSGQIAAIQTAGP